jgi:protein TonB
VQKSYRLPLAINTSLFIYSVNLHPPKPVAVDESNRPRIRIASVLGSNKLTHYVRPVYPKEARKTHIHGMVRLRATITKTGELRDIQVLQVDPLLIPAALKAVKQWRYEPTLLNSEPVEVITDIKLSFYP